MPSEEEKKQAYQAAADWVSKTFPNGEERYPHWPMIEAALEAAEQERQEGWRDEEYVKIPTGITQMGTGIVNIRDNGSLADIEVNFRVNDTFRSERFAVPKYLPNPPIEESDNAE